MIALKIVVASMRSYTVEKRDSSSLKESCEDNNHSVADLGF